MAGLLGGMNLRKPNIPANTGGAMAQGLTTGMQMGQNIWENIQRNAQWNMTKDMAFYEYNIGKAYDTNLPLEMRRNHGKVAMKTGEKIFKDNNPNLFDDDDNLIVAKPMMEYRKRVTGLNKEYENKKITFQDYTMALMGNATELGIDMGKDPVFTAMKEMEKENRIREEDKAAKQGLLGLNPPKFGLNPLQPNEWTPTIGNEQKLNEFNTRQGLLMTQPYETLKGIATAEPKLPLLSKQEESDIAVNQALAIKRGELEINPPAPTPHWVIAIDKKGIRRHYEANSKTWGELAPPEKQNIDEDSPIDRETIKNLQEQGYPVKYGITYRAFNLRFPITETTTGTNQYGEPYSTKKERERGGKIPLKPAFEDLSPDDYLKQKGFVK